MKNLFPSSIRSKLILLGVLAFLPVVLLTVFNSWYQRRLEVAEANERMAKILDFAILHEEEDHPGDPSDSRDTGGCADSPRGRETRERIFSPGS